MHIFIFLINKNIITLITQKVQFNADLPLNCDRTLPGNIEGGPCPLQSASIYDPPLMKVASWDSTPDTICNIYIYAYIHVYICIYTYVYICVHAHIYIHMRICVYMCIYACIYIHAHMYTYIYINIHIYIHINLLHYVGLFCHYAWPYF